MMKILFIFGTVISLAFGQTFYKEVTIGDVELDPGPGLIEGSDFYNVARFKKFDPGAPVAQQQVEGDEGLDEAPYWLLYENDYDSYQEKQNQKLFNWQKKTGRYRQD
ncbi:MAG: hypothetical protein KC478_12420 [Bacteriovoracaceae bacterium]|nr:hypothetical protein [Bacteriovoracaceae bacterium]